MTMPPVASPADHATTPVVGPEPRPEPLMTSVLYVARRWPLLLLWMAAGAIAAAGYAATRPRQFVSLATFVPVGRGSAASSASSIAGSLGIGGLSSDAEGPQFYADLLHSPELLLAPLKESLPVGDSTTRGHTLLDIYGRSIKDPALREEQVLDYVGIKVVGTAVTAKTGVVQVNVSTAWPTVSQWLARRLLDQLDAFNIERRRTQAEQERRFAQQLLQARRDSLRLAENRYEGFVLANRQYSNSPALTLEAARLQRETTLQLSLLTSATSQYEDARLREIRDTPTIMLIQSPRVPAQARPKPIVRTAMFGAALALVVCVLGLLFRRAVAVHRSLGDPEAEYLSRALDAVGRGRRRGGMDDHDDSVLGERVRDGQVHDGRVRDGGVPTA